MFMADELLSSVTCKKMLKPHDVLCVLKISCLSGKQWTFRELGASVGLSNGEAYNSLGRLKAAALVFEKDNEVKLAPRRLLDFLVHGVPTAYYQVRGAVVRGMLTGSHAPPLVDRCTLTDGDIPLVWPSPSGKAKGETLVPIYDTVPMAAAADPRLYELLVLVDGLRTGRARERKLAAELLELRLVPQGAAQPAE
jgi:hypothetical protein